MPSYEPKPVPEVAPEDMHMPQTLLTDESVPGRWPIIMVILLALVLIVIGIGLYIWSTQVDQPTVDTAPPITRPTAAENNEPESTTAEAIVETQSALSSSSNLDVIEADLSATLLPELDSAFADIEAVLQN